MAALHAGRKRLAYLLSLLQNDDFRRESVAAIKAAHKFRPIDEESWASAYPAYCEQTLHPFLEKWKALPVWDLDLADPDPRRRVALTVQAGRWGLVPVFPWTTDKEVKGRVHHILQLIGRERSVTAAARRGAIAGWLSMHGAPRDLIAEGVWKTRVGLRRSTVRRAVSRLSLKDETELMKRFLEQGLSYPEAERRTLRAARGTESRASATVRMAQARHNRASHQLTEDLIEPKPHDPIASLLTKAFLADFDGRPDDVSLLLRDLRLRLLPPGS